MRHPDDDPEDLGADLYREMLIDHYQRPRNAGRLDPADVVFDGDNPSCGDKLTVTARVNQDRIAEIRFEGVGCAISQAAASILYEDVKGKSLDDVLALGRKDVEDLIGITLRPARVKCGVLGLNSLKHGIQQYQSTRERRQAPRGFRAKGGASS